MVLESVGQQLLKDYKSDPMIEHINSNVEENKTSDFNEWLQAMKMVAYLPDGTPTEFRRKLWLALSEQYLSMKNIDWETERVKYFCNTSENDDENLGDQIMKDLHRTGSSLCSGPAGSINQAKLKRILQGYARWNPEVGYCQGFNMLGALILQVMDKEEMESMKVMIYLIEGIFPSGYFSGSLNGLQVDMAVFRELMLARLPKLAKHLQRLQGSAEERCCEPPLTNVFTIQWFITMFSTSLPFNSVLRIWDLVLIEGSGILLRAALAIWSILEDKILCSKSADDFYCKMGELSADMLSGTIINSNGLIEKIVEFGPIPQLEQLRKKQLTNIKSWTADRKIKFSTLDEDGDSDDEGESPGSKTIGMRLVRRRSSRITINRKTLAENRERIALDIPLLKKQYDRIREHQRQAHIILSAAVARQSVVTSISPNTLTSNMLLDGRNSRNSNRTVPTAKHSQYNCKILKSAANQNENNSFSISKKISPKLKKKLIYQKHEQLEEQIGNPVVKSSSILNVGAKSLKRNESSSFSDSDNNSSTSTSLCDEDDSDHTINFESSIESSPLHQTKNNNCQFSTYDHLKIYNDRVANKLSLKRDKSDDSLIKNSLCCDDSPKLTSDSDKNVLQTMSLPTYSVEEELADTNIICDIDIEKTINAINSELISKIEIANSPICSQQNTSMSKTILHTANTSSFLNKNINSLSKNSFVALNQFSESNSLVDLPIEESIPSTNFQFSVNESGVTNKYFERINDIKTPTYINLDLLSFQKCGPVPVPDGTSIPVNEINNIIMESTEAKLNSNSSNTIISTLSSENILNTVKKVPETSEMESSYSSLCSPKSVSFPESSEQCQSELASRIIEENSRMLHRILNKDFTLDKNNSCRNDEAYKTNETSKYVFNDICYPEDILNEKSVEPIINESKFHENIKISDLNNFGNQKATDVILEEESYSNKLVKFDDVKNIVTKSNNDIQNSFAKDTDFITEPDISNPKSLKSPSNDSLKYSTNDGAIDNLSNNNFTINNDENLKIKKDPYTMLSDEISPQNNLKEVPFNLPDAFETCSILTNTNLSNSIISLTEPAFKLETSNSLDIKDTILEDSTLDNQYNNTYLRATKSELSTSNDIPDAIDCSSWLMENNIVDDKPYFNAYDHEKQAIKNVDKDDLHNKNYNSLTTLDSTSNEICSNLFSETCPNELDKYTKDISLNKHMDVECIFKNPEFKLEKNYEFKYLSKNCDKEAMDSSFDKGSKAMEILFDKNSEVTSIQDKAMSLNDSPIQYVSNNKLINEEYYIKGNKKENMKYDLYPKKFSQEYDEHKTDMPTDHINNYKVAETTAFSKNKYSSYLDSFEICNKFENALVTPSKEMDLVTPSKEMDLQLNKIEITNQQFDTELYAVKTSKTDLKSETNISDESIIIMPTLNNETMNKYSKYSKDENINDRLISIKNTIKSIDSLCDDTIYNRFSKKEDEYDTKNLLRPLYKKKDYKNSQIYNFEENNFMGDNSNFTKLMMENKTSRKDQFKYCNSDENKSTNYSNHIYTTPPKLEIRHTTVTSTLYDRILAQKEEKQKRLEKNLCEKKATTIDTNLTSLNILNINSHSAESSPLKIKTETTNSKSDSKSCSNILMQLQNRT